MALSGNLVLEEAMNLSLDYVMNRNILFKIITNRYCEYFIYF